MSKGNVLLTGGLGYIGSHITCDLMHEGYTTTIVDNLCNSSESMVEKIRTITGIKPKIYIGDVRDKELMNAIFQENKIDCVIHLAGLKSVTDSCKDPIKYHVNNVGATLSLLECMQKNHVSKIIFSSSATVYDLSKPGPLKETSALKPSTPYGQTKLICEKIIQDACNFGNVKSVILRYFNPIGCHPSGLIDENPNNTPNNIYPIIQQVLRGDREHLTIFGNDYPTPDGTCIRDYIDISDLSRAHVQSIHWLEEDTRDACEIFNVGTGRGTSVLELIDQIERKTGKKIPHVFGPRREGDMAEYYCDPGKYKVR